MTHRVREPKDDVLDLVVDSATGLEGFALGVSGEIVEVSLEDPECLVQREVESVSYEAH